MEIRIASNPEDKWATILRAMITAISAAKKLHNDNLVAELTKIKDSANEQYNTSISA